MINRIALDPRTLHGKPHVRGTRIAVSHVLELLASGLTPEAICRAWYPDLTVTDVRACIAFANDFLSGEEVRMTPSHLARR